MSQYLTRFTGVASVWRDLRSGFSLLFLLWAFKVAPEPEKTGLAMALLLHGKTVRQIDQKLSALTSQEQSR